MDERLKVLQFGAMLHDIGKLVRRAGIGAKDHTQEGAEFVKEYLKIDPVHLNSIISIMKHHHYKYLDEAALNNDDLAYLVYEADNIASSVDRRKYEDNSRGDEKSYLNSVFNVLTPHKSIESKKFKIDLLENSKLNLPRTLEGEAGTGAFAKIYELYKTNIQTISSIDEFNKILLLSEQTLSYFPSSSYVDRPDTSLYDHSKLTCAIASCMYLYDEDNQMTDYKSEYFINTQSRMIDKFILVSGELSGIQDFIYTITSKMAMKSLRGRSFYLDLLTENIVDEIIALLGLSRANLIYSGGSHFYLLLPNTEFALNLLEDYKGKINRFLLEREGTALYFEYATTSVNANSLSNGIGESIKSANFLGDAFGSLSSEITRKKMQRYSKDQLEALFNVDNEVNAVLNDSKECSICKKSASNAELEKNASKNHGSNICNSCSEYIELGKNIAKIYTNKNQEYFFVLSESGNGVEIPQISGKKLNIDFVKSEELKRMLKEKKPIPRIYSINGQYIGENLQTNILVGNYNCSSNDRELIEFSDLAKRAKGIPRLAVLRADVDNLSSHFRNGFENQESPEQRYRHVTFSKSAVLSRYLSDFFKRKVNVLLSKRDIDLGNYEVFTEYASFLSGKEDTDSRDIVLVYSGGDDLFAIGTWHDVIEFSVDLRNAFKEFTNSKVTLSAGIGIYSAGYPVHQMAKQTGKLENMAKVNNNNMKDSIALLGVATNNYGVEEQHVFTWDRFIGNVIQGKYMFLKNNVRFVEVEIDTHNDRVFIGKSILYRLIDLIRSTQCDADNRIDIARFAYTLARIKHNSTQDKSYQAIKIKLFEWIKNPSDAQELLTALILLVYGLRESEG